MVFQEIVKNAYVSRKDIVELMSIERGPSSTISAQSTQETKGKRYTGVTEARVK